jgi:hypothetical protein
VTDVLGSLERDMSFDSVWEKVINVFIDIVTETEFWLDFIDQINKRRM